MIDDRWWRGKVGCMRERKRVRAARGSCRSREKQRSHPLFSVSNMGKCSAFPGGPNGNLGRPSHGRAAAGFAKFWSVQAYRRWQCHENIKIINGEWVERLTGGQLDRCLKSPFFFIFNSTGFGCIEKTVCNEYHNKLGFVELITYYQNQQKHIRKALKLCGRKEVIGLPFVLSVSFLSYISYLAT